MDKFKSWLVKFMYGRYGVDQLYRGILGTGIVLLVINLFAQTLIIAAITWILFLWAFYRAFSKNIAKRRRENNHYLQLIAPIKKSLIFKRIRDIGHYRYRRCSNCKQIMRLKRKPGKHSLVCPKCQTKMDVRIIV